jgi:DNA invertase Pin-like site-specific DNA recombinase
LKLTAKQTTHVAVCERNVITCAKAETDSRSKKSSSHHPGGTLVFHVFAALAEFERDLIRERTSAGLAAARARGRRGGRPSVLAGQKLRLAQEMYRSGGWLPLAR